LSSDGACICPSGRTGAMSMQTDALSVGSPGGVSDHSLAELGRPSPEASRDQVRVMRELLATTSRELAGMRDDIVELMKGQAALERRASDAECMQMKQTDELRRIARTSAKDIEEVRLWKDTWEAFAAGSSDAQEVFEGRLNRLESIVQECSEQQQQDVRIIRDLQDLQGQISTSVAAHAMELGLLRELPASVELLRERCGAISPGFARARGVADRSAGSDDIGALRQECEECLHAIQELQDQQVSQDERIKYAEMLFGESIEKHSQELKTLSHNFSGCAQELNHVHEVLKRLSIASGDDDMNFNGIRSLFSTQAKFWERLSNLDEMLLDTKTLPERIRSLEAKFSELHSDTQATSTPMATPSSVCRPLRSPRLDFRALQPRHTASAASRKPSVAERSPSETPQEGDTARSKRSLDGVSMTEALAMRVADQGVGRAVAASIGHSVSTLNGRKHISFDMRTRRAVFLQEPAMKRRSFGRDHVDDPVAEWVDCGALQPALQDIVILFEILTAAVREQNPQNGVTVVVFRSRVRGIAGRSSDARRQTSPQSRPSMSTPTGSRTAARQNSRPLTPRTPAAISDRAGQWETQLAQSRVNLIASTLVDYGIPPSSLQAKVVDGSIDSYYIQFDLDLRGTDSSPVSCEANGGH